jgi:holo-[acyl-carrier protein] synthase
MPLRPFPLPISIGTDLCSINRVRAIISKGDNNFRRYLRRFLTPREQSALLRQYGNADLTDYQTLERLSHILAGRYVSFMAAL